MKRTAQLTTAALLLAAFALAKPQPGAAPSPFLDTDELAQALASSLPERLPASDGLDFFYARRTRRGGDDYLADRQILSGHQARFQGYGQTEDLRRAEALADSLLRGRPGDAALWATRAQIHMARHEFKKAREAAERALELAPTVDGSLYRFRLFDTYLAAGMYDQAERLLDLPHDRDSFQYIVRQARMADRKGDVKGARDLMLRALGLAEAYALPDLVRAWNLVELGHLEHHGGNTRAGVARYLEALEVAPGYPAALEGLGWIAFGSDRNGPAAEALFHAALENGGHADLHLALAEVARFNGDAQGAKQETQALTALAGQDPATRRLFARPLAVALSKEGNLREALQLAREDLAERTPAESWATYGWVTHRLGHTAAAERLFDRALDWGTPEPMVYYLAGKAALERGDTKEARKLLGIALKAGAELGPVVTGELEGLMALT